ncbi:MAG: hypothetical protein P1P82_05585 [Bacteroidales bacterium]|nr:hypothetical protein [Bacteroidales bacterium]MDT8431395.1 hypothetical protein [Bacteroidales bacterium]
MKYSADHDIIYVQDIHVTVYGCPEAGHSAVTGVLASEDAQTRFLPATQKT